MQSKSSFNYQICLALVLGVLAHGISGCTAYYTASDLRKNFSQAVDQSQEIAQMISQDLLEKQQALQQLTNHSSAADLPPYPELQTIVAKMGQMQGEIAQDLIQLKQLKAELFTLTKGVKQIKSNEPSWDEYKLLKSRYDVLTGHFETLIGPYNETSNSFISLANQYQISKVNIPQLQAIVTKYMAEVEVSIQDVRKALYGYRQQLKTAHSQNMKADKLTAYESRLAQAEQILARIESKQDQLAGKLKRFETEVDQQQEIWVGPGMQTFSIITEMTTLGDEIRAEGNKLKALGSKP